MLGSGQLQTCMVQLQADKPVSRHEMAPLGLQLPSSAPSLLENREAFPFDNNVTFVAFTFISIALSLFFQNEKFHFTYHRDYTCYGSLDRLGNDEAFTVLGVQELWPKSLISAMRMKSYSNNTKSNLGVFYIGCFHNIYGPTGNMKAGYPVVVDSIAYATEYGIVGSLFLSNTVDK
ncbi:hypothetical protein VNO78_20187 [Psophocarpus tetragonolobus]|uniref:Uncharacterized protein n=1 Tax=Psophocarpus tetragonolobus TaxID=3891 RepID=A0AAN9S9F7_PSOTE